MAFLSLGQPLAFRAFPFQRKGIDEARFLLSNFKVQGSGLVRGAGRPLIPYESFARMRSEE